MHDTYLINKISKSLNEICTKSNICKITQLTIVVNHSSHVNEKNLQEHLIENNKDLLANEFKVIVQREDIENQTAIIHSIQGETFEE
ncbi:MAG: hypothetical protein K0Q97_2108 [Bacillota bacterium]|jgi:Zn finger protein HypA/HybF involved in hydrogenase expression|nr:hypothetical protein [Bacillota bacterium]